MVEIETRAFNDDWEQFEIDYFLKFLKRLAGANIDAVKYDNVGAMIHIYGYSKDEVYQALYDTMGVEYYD